jgi:hypothetical protein
MSRVTADPQSIAVPCPRCGRPPLSRCTGTYGHPVPTHRARVRAGLEAAKEEAT